MASDLVPVTADVIDPPDLGRTHLGIVDFKRWYKLLGFQPISVDAYDYFFAPIDRCLPNRRRSLDAQLGPTRLHRSRHSAFRLYLGNQCTSFVYKLVGERFDVVGAPQRINHIGDFGFVLQDQLRIACNPRRGLGRQRDGLIERIGVQALRAAKHRRQRLVSGAYNVVVGVLLGQRHARCLAVRPQHLRA